MYGLLNTALDAGKNLFNTASNPSPEQTLKGMGASGLSALGYAGGDMLGGRRMAPYGAAVGGAMGGAMMNPENPLFGAGIGGAMGYGGSKAIQGIGHLGNQFMQLPGMPEHLMLEGVNQGAQALGNYFWPQNNTQPMNNTASLNTTNPPGFYPPQNQTGILR